MKITTAIKAWNNALVHHRLWGPQICIEMTRGADLYTPGTSLLLPNKRFALNNCVEICTGVRFECRNVQGSFMKEVHASSV